MFGLEINQIIESLSCLIPSTALKIGRDKYMTHVKQIESFYNLDNFIIEAEMWYEKALVSSDESELLGLLDNAVFFPAVKCAITIFLTLPSTTCTVERSFSTMRRVKTWLRNTMSDDRLSGLCVLSVHRNWVNQNRDKFIDDVIDLYASDRRRLQFLFN